ncbi:MAG: glutamate--cysteine ligase [Woeseia sp.]|nr:glutamate--cysteine ligase [Woeseia sp.]MBT8095832.1 glutamate--cysteine ligase [Woeseia sp.]NNE61718.1 glutamate--cysteine ligase [Woeseia sp.]NNL55086.1 glutamate--cysteine ligase [Woeseia sp.]
MFGSLIARFGSVRGRLYSRCILEFGAHALSAAFQQRLGRLVKADSGRCLQGGFRGIEKESLRVTPDGYLSRAGHPAGLGSALTNPFITTDFSEALLEFVTPAVGANWEALRDLCDIHQFCYPHLGEELLWVTSMPCKIPPDDDIPLARYGNSNVGQMKNIYRRGLGYRYGRAMQTIAGLHFNYSLPGKFWETWQELEGNRDSEQEFRSAAYLGLIRNFRRFGWLLLYLTGASPALCKSFAQATPAGMPELDEATFYQPFATSLRMSDLGYSNKTQARLNISLNRLEDYIADLSSAICSPEPAYEKIGVKVDGKYRQLNSNHLQIENEYYSPIRPKRVAHSGERPTAALRRGGIEYVEVRSIDLNIFDPVGLNQNVMRFVEAFLIYCLLEESPPLEEGDWDELLQNHTQTAKQGRDPDFRLRRHGKLCSLRSWAAEIMPGVAAVAELLDAGSEQQDYRAAVNAQAELLDDPAATPSARLLNELTRNSCSFFEFAMAAARGHRDYFSALTPLPAERLASYEAAVKDSLELQKSIEADDRIGFDEYLAAYYASGPAG